MKALYHNQAGVRALTKNIAYTATSGGDYWESGLACVPNTTATTSILVDVEGGSVNIGGESVSIASQSVELSPASNNPRIDVIQATANGMSVVEGNEQVKRPNSTDDGTEGTFPNIWQPPPDDGQLVDGVARAIVYVRPSVSDSTDLTASDIRNFDAAGSGAVREDNLQSAVEGLTDPVGIQAADAQELDSDPPGRYLRNSFSMQIPGEPKVVPGTDSSENNFFESIMHVPVGHRIEIDRTSITTAGGVNPTYLEIAVYLVRSGTTYNPWTSANAAEYSTGSTGPVAVLSSFQMDNPQTMKVRLQNTRAAESDTAQAQANIRIVDTARDN